MSAHLAMQGLYGFRQEFGFYPESNNREHVEQMLALVRKFCNMVWYFTSILPLWYSVLTHTSINSVILLSCRMPKR